MHVVVIGSGGREHALVKKIASSALVEQVTAIPGNPGTALVPKVSNAPVPEAEWVNWAVDAGVHLVVVGPEAPLVTGLADRLRAKGIPTIGPDALGARLEGSKAFAKELMLKANVPTARSGVVTSAAEVDTFVDGFDGTALVVKADGLAGGKGVLVFESVEPARKAAKAMLELLPFGEASRRVLLEERLEGPEVSFIVLTDGERFVTLPTSQDHKRLGEGDTGPNTGGMGAYTPAAFVNEAIKQELEATVIVPILEALRATGSTYRGFLYAGIMLTADGPKVLEFNVRLGDPETQALMTAIDDDIVPALIGAANGELTPERWSSRPAAVVVLAAEGYPQAPIKGTMIEGIAEADAIPAVSVIQAGTRSESGHAYVNGGRVLGVTASGETIQEALTNAYAGVDMISWPGMHFRRDIGWFAKGEG